MQQSVLKIHAGYIIGILAACCIFQTAYDWHSDKSVVDLLSFEIGLTSLILALIAIVQNIVSAPNFSNSIVELKKTAKNIGISTEGLKSAETMLTDKLKDIGGISTQMTSLRKDLIDKLDQNLMASSTSNINHGPLFEHQAAQRIDLTALSPASAISQYFLYKASKVNATIDPMAIFSGEQDFIARCIMGYAAALKDIGVMNWTYNNGFKDLKFEDGFDVSQKFISISARDDQMSADARIAIDIFFNNLNNDDGADSEAKSKAN